MLCLAPDVEAGLGFVCTPLLPTHKGCCGSSMQRIRYSRRAVYPGSVNRPAFHATAHLLLLPCVFPLYLPSSMLWFMPCPAAQACLAWPRLV